MHCSQQPGIALDNALQTGMHMQASTIRSKAAGSPGVTIVNTAQELVDALLRNDVHIELRQHIVLTSAVTTHGEVLHSLEGLAVQHQGYTKSVRVR
jgi:hypothetical protein